ncbi:MAG: hypothetical protein PHN55_13240, partial [Dysgonamonadaceae bacterium]|nr:hypothetical protein [Dysgonamonadaceae bacterium]
MKHALKSAIFFVTVIFAMVFLMGLLSHNAAASSPNVIYISDAGTGDGSSPSSPLKAVTVIENTTPPSDPNYQFWYGQRYYMNCVLYQAFEKLTETGGTVVLVGDVTIGYSKTYSNSSITSRDYYFPDHGENMITVTSSYNGVNYGAKLTLTEGAYLSLSGNTTFENITFATGETNRAICCNNNKAVFGEGIVCVTTSGHDATPSNATRFLSIAGGTRYAA